ncbi:unnamed protein product [Closterium sp. Yama58-4]|nr:unnamed protein product [Closterium sp. Yama58-4]
MECGKSLFPGTLILLVEGPQRTVYGPEKDNVYATSAFPAIRDAIADIVKSSASKGNLEDGAGGAVSVRSSSEGGEEWSAVQHEIFRAARAIERAAKILKGQLLVSWTVAQRVVDRGTACRGPWHSVSWTVAQRVVDRGAGPALGAHTCCAMRLFEAPVLHGAG